jgi:propionyl-CoA carboxylase alpha chain
VIAKLLVANRGEIARRVFRTARRLGIGTVAVYTEPDAVFVREADEAVRIESYLRADEIVAAAARTGADAVHPGYGFLSEDSSFARCCVDAGLTWIGPPPEVLELAGSKLRARELARERDIHVLDGEGFPALVKANAGGGGRGMRIVTSPAELEAARESAAREAEAAFGDSTLYVERFVPHARHVEVQILGDTHGRVVHLYGRDCTVQRRWQKVIEEAPFTDERVLAAAVALGEAMGYVNAGTVEFLLASDGDFFFLEVNARLQVEHPVTEAVTGLDLVELQLRVAEGAPLPSLVTECHLEGHAVEARLYAESAGVVSRFAVDGVRVESGVEAGSRVGTEFDPMIAKLVAHAPTRAEAIRKLAGALRRTRVHGVETNRELVLAALENPAFAAEEVDTQWFERLEHITSPRPLHALAAALAGQAARRAGETLPSGWRNNPSQLQRAAFAEFDVGYRLQDAVFEVNGERVDARLVSCTHERVELEVDGVLGAYEIHIDGAHTWVDGPDGSSSLEELDRFPSVAAESAAGELVSPLPGSVVRVEVEPGQKVETGQALVVVEAMKMEHTVTAPRPGRVAEVRVCEGEQVGGGHVLVVLEAAQT